MNFITKSLLFVLSILIFYGCASSNITYSKTLFEQLGLFKNNVVQDTQYSYIEYKQNSSIRVLVLSTVENNIELWVGQNYEKLWTYNGFIIKATGFNNDLLLDSNVSLLDSISANDFDLKISLVEPHLFKANITISKVHKSSSKDCESISRYSRKFTDYGLRDNIVICMNNGLTKYSRQKLNPLGSYTEITYHY